MVPVLLAAFASAAGAHAAYKSSEPASDAAFGLTTSRVTAELTEPPAEGSYLRVTGPCGERVDAGDVGIVDEMSVSMSAAEAWRYVVSFRALSRLDPRVTEGEFGFTASDGRACPRAQPQPIDEAEEGPVADAPASSEGSEGTIATGYEGLSAGQSGAGTGDAGRGGTNRAVTNRPGKGFRVADRTAVPHLQAAAAREDEDEDEERSVWDGIPIASFATGLLLAAVIGAAGGKIYAGIMGPRA